MEIHLIFNTENAKQEIAEFKQYVDNRNPQGIKLSLVQKSHEEGKLGVDWINLIQIGLTTTGAGIAIKGFFDLLKAYIVDLKQHKLTTEAEENQNQREYNRQIIQSVVDNGFVTFVTKDKEGNETSTPVRKFSNEELAELINLIEK